MPVLDNIFSFVGIPSILKSDNGPPFNGHEFKDFLKYMGINHRLITPAAPQVNGLVEHFMQPLAKVIRSALVEEKPYEAEVNKFLRNYRSVPHPSTGVAPSNLLFNRNRTSRFPHITSNENDDRTDKFVQSKDAGSKLKSKVYTDKKRHARFDDLEIGDVVYGKQKRTNKFMTKFF